jgi:hypothetical protein
LETVRWSNRKLDLKTWGFVNRVFTCFFWIMPEMKLIIFQDRLSMSCTASKQHVVSLNFFESRLKWNYIYIWEVFLAPKLQCSRHIKNQK